MDDSFAKSVGQSRRIKALPKELIVPKAEWDSYYNHVTIRVRSLAEYIDVINRLSLVAKNTDKNPLVFRGHSNASSDYKLIPILGRKALAAEFCEEKLVNEMLTLRPEEFSDIHSDFDLLSKMQHFGLPTRLLDYTYNPLIALYFACCSKKKMNGRVICTYDTSSPSSADLIETICGMYKYRDLLAVSIEDILGGISGLRHYAICTSEHLMAKPKYSNDRIKHQSAVFMVFPNKVCDFRSRMVVLGKKDGNEETYRMGFTIDEEETKRLEYIREEKEIYDNSFLVNTKSLRNLFQYYSRRFDDFYNKSSSKIDEKYGFLFKNRFTILGELQELSSEMLSSSFVSVLIGAKDKERLLKELGTIGIDKAFVFPELEYTAEMIKNIYFRS